MSDAADKSRWLRGASVQEFDYTDLLTKILRTAASDFGPQDSAVNTASVLMASQVNRAKQSASSTEDSANLQPLTTVAPQIPEATSTTQQVQSTELSVTSTNAESSTEPRSETTFAEVRSEAAASEAASRSRLTYTAAPDTGSTEVDYTKLPDEPDIVKPPSFYSPPKQRHPLASVLSDEAIERLKHDASWSNFLEIYPRKTESTELELSRLDSGSRLKPMAIDGVPRHSPYAFYSSFSETVPTLHQSILNSAALASSALINSEPLQWWQSPYLIYGLVILFLAVLMMSMTLQCCVIYSQRKQIEYLRDESVRSRTCPSIPSYLVRVPANTEVMGPRISDAVVPSATTNIGSRTLDELVDEVERRITKQLIKYNQRSLPPDIRSSSEEKTPERRQPSARNSSARPPRARVGNSGTSSSTSFSPPSVVRVDHHATLSSTRSLEEPSEMLSVALGNSSSSPATSSLVNQGRKPPRPKVASRMS